MRLRFCPATGEIYFMEANNHVCVAGNCGEH
nr:MAG TPA: 30S ribosomal protein S27 [Caudoviricetes sp.]